MTQPIKNLRTQFQGDLGSFTLNVDLDLPPEGVTAIFGPSGCGKTSLLRCVAGLERLRNGLCKIDGETWQDDTTFLPPHKRQVGYVFQEPSLFPHLTVRSNLAYGLNRAKSSAKLPRLKSVEALLGLKHLIDRTPDKLSGGERQRVAIGRALMSGPKILLMDEPLSALDQLNKDEIMPLMERIADFLSIPVLYVSHDMAEVERLAEYIVFMKDGETAAQGPIQHLAIDKTSPFAQMPQPFAIVDTHVKAHDTTYGLTTFSLGRHDIVSPDEKREIGTSGKLRIYASDIALAKEKPKEATSYLNVLAARINDVHPISDHRLNVYLKLGTDGDGPCLFARITKKAWDDLGLEKGGQVFALVKRVNFMGRR